MEGVAFSYVIVTKILELNGYDLFELLLLSIRQPEY
jgi:hypothetical protein